MSDKHPDVIVIWQHSGECHMTGAKEIDGNWLYSPWTVIPESELTEFLDWRKSNGAQVYNFRQLAEEAGPGWGSVTPLIVAQNGTPIAKAIEAATTIWAAIIEDDQP